MLTNRLPRLSLRHLKWYHMYFALALFDLMTVVASVMLSHSITGIYERSVADNRKWADRLGRYSELGRLASAVNAPGNDVFDSRDVEAERGRMNEALVRFEASLKTERDDLAALPDQAQSKDLLTQVARIEASMREMLGEASQIFSLFSMGDAESAGKRMATMDRKFAALNEAFGDLSTRVRAIQSDRFTEQAAAADTVRRYEMLLLVVILLMITGVTLYGHKLARAMADAERERDRQSAALIEKTKALEQSMKAAEAANVEKTRFLARMSHEIRTPMNGVLGMTGKLLKSPLSDRQREQAGVVQRSAEALLAIINDILDLSRIEAGKIELEVREFDLRHCLEGTVLLLAEQAQSKDIALDIYIADDLPPTLVGDSGRLRQIVTNLVGNAIKFTESGDVSVWATRQAAADGAGADRMVIEVRDSGIGMAPEIIDKLFQPFTQADTSISRRFGGAGLGLSIARQLAGLLGGTIELRSKPGRGTTAVVTLPITPGTTAAGQPLPDLAQRRILVIDAGLTTRQIIEKYLQARGADVTSVNRAEKGVLALEQAATAGRPFATVIIDMMLPGADGQTVARRIRDDERHAGLAIVLIADNSEIDRLEKSDGARIGATVARPVMRAGLLKAICDGVSAPAAARVAPATVSRAAQRIGTGRTSVLLAEDNPINVEVAVTYLEDLECDVTVAANGQQATELLQSGTGFDIVLMDCQMPVLDGLSATRMIREIERRSGRRRLPIIALTANAFEGDRQDCLAAGMDDYMSKPFSEQQLASMLARWRSRSAPQPKTVHADSEFAA